MFAVCRSSGILAHSLIERLAESIRNRCLDDQHLPWLLLELEHALIHLAGRKSSFTKGLVFANRHVYTLDTWNRAAFGPALGQLNALEHARPGQGQGPRQLPQDVDLDHSSGLLSDY